MNKKEKQLLYHKFFSFLEDKENKPIPLNLDYKVNPEKYKGRKVLDSVYLSPSLYDKGKVLKQIAPNLVTNEFYWEEDQKGDGTGMPDIKLPDNLEVFGELELLSKEGIDLPDSLKVHNKILLNHIPKTYPEHLENKIFVNSIPLLPFKKLEPLQIKIGGAKVQNGTGIHQKYGKKLPPDIIDVLRGGDDDELKGYQDFKRSVIKLAEKMGFKWEDSYILLGGTFGLFPVYIVAGKSSKGKSVIFYNNNNTSKSVLRSEEGGLLVTRYHEKTQFSNMGSTMKEKILAKLFPSESDKKTTSKSKRKEIPPKAADVYISLPGLRIERGGAGIKGPFNKALPYVPSTTSVFNLQYVAEKLGIEWDKMVVYKKESRYSPKGFEVLFAAVSKPKDRKIFMYDRGGIGPGGYSKIYSNGGTKVNASRVIDGIYKFKDFASPSLKEENLNEIDYNDILAPKSMNILQKKSAENLKKMIRGDVSRAMMKSMEILDEIMRIEAPYRTHLEELAVRIAKEHYGIVEDNNIKIEVMLSDNIDINLTGSEKSVSDLENTEDLTLDITGQAKRRIINSITQGASIKGSYLFHLYKEYLDEINPKLIKKYADLLNISYGIYDDDDTIAMMLTMLSMNQQTNGGEVEAVYEKETKEFKVKAKALIFPILLQEVIKGLYEIVSLQGFSTNPIANKRIVNKVDVSTNEPEDIRYGKYIVEKILELLSDFNSTNTRIRDYFLADLYKMDDVEFISFIDNLLQDKLTSDQKYWVKSALIDIQNDLKKDDTDLEDLD